MLSPAIASESPVRELEGRRVLVLIHGELAQSPRMLNHARALCAAGATVSLVGYSQLPLPSDLAGMPGLTIRRLSETGGERLDSVPRIFYLPVAASRATRASVRLAWFLAARAGRFDTAIVQTPPALPAGALALLAARTRHARLIVDWRGRTAATLGFRLGRRHPAVHVADRIERWLAHKASAHFAASDAMRQDLRERFGINSTVLRDRPRRRAAPLSAEQRLSVLRRVLAARRALPAPGDTFVLVSPSSFSAEEDMNMLLDALALVARRSPAVPLLLFATGYGPLRARFESRARKISGENFRVVTGWLPEPLYRDLLRAADLGISIHRSASGVDLPMKVVDMIEAGLPAAVFDYGPCLSELVPAALKPFMFTDTEGLAARVMQLMNGAKLADLQASTMQEPGPSWAEEWRRVGLPVIADHARGPQRG